MHHTVTATAARSSLPAILERVAKGGEIVITRHGRPVAVIIHPDALRVRRNEALFDAADDVADLLDEAAATDLADAPVLTTQQADERVRELRASRRRH